MKETVKTSIIKPDDPRWAPIVENIGMTNKGLPPNVLGKLLALGGLNNVTQPKEKEVNDNE